MNQSPPLSHALLRRLQPTCWDSSCCFSHCFVPSSGSFRPGIRAEGSSPGSGSESRGWGHLHWMSQLLSSSVTPPLRWNLHLHAYTQSQLARATLWVGGRLWPSQIVSIAQKWLQISTRKSQYRMQRELERELSSVKASENLCRHFWGNGALVE